MTQVRPARKGRSVAGSLDELLAGATAGDSVKPADSKSGAAFQRVVIDGKRFVVKHLVRDWLADASCDDTCRAVGLFEDGVYDNVSDIVDTTVVAAARLSADSPWPAALLMRDATDEFIAEDTAVDLPMHAAIIETMAALHARFWLHPPPTTYMPFAVNYALLSPRQARRERTVLGDRSEVLRHVHAGWADVAAAAPACWPAVERLLDQPAPLVDALARTPVTFLHGDWKMGNLGRRPDGQVVLVDWDRPAVGPATADLAWYLSVNCDRLPESKEAAIARYRVGLEQRGVDTAPWWDAQLDLALLGAFLMLGWSKSGQAHELDWWVAAADRAVRLL